MTNRLARMLVRATALPLIWGACSLAQPVTLNSLLKEMADRDGLARFPSPVYKQGQGSTYNRASYARNQPDQTFSGWFADGDGGYYIRTENTNAGGATEYVVMERNGPGAITKLWTPFFYQDFNNRTGPNIKIYLNGSNAPVINENLIELVTRLGWSTAEYGSKPSSRNSFTLPSPIANFTARAGDCYLPIPFSAGCKVTISSAPFYDIVSYRAYAPGTVVEDFSMASLNAASNQTQMALTVQQIATPTNFSGGQLFQANQSILPGQSLSLALNAGAAAVRHLEVQLDPSQLQTNAAALRSTVLLMTFDGEQTVWCPLGDFFCSADQLHPFQTWTRTVTTNDALMVCRWVMPYQTSASVTLTNLGGAPMTARLAIRTGAWTWDNQSMHFHANWRPDDVRPGTPPVDWNFIDITGQGVFVGDAWTVLDIQPGTWWGEGDEKIYVDSEYDTAKFPGIYGTGTEDYYGWAGGVVPTRTDEFNNPYLANVRVGGLDGYTLGFNINTRTRALDAIPFNQRLVFDMESSFGTDIRNPWNLLGYSAAVFWYAMPGATHNRPAQPGAAAQPIQTIAQLQQMSDAIRYPPVVPNAIPRPRWNLGEQDPVATPGGPGNATTKDANGTNDLTAFGTPTYSANVPAGGSTLSMSFNGSSFYQGSGAGISNLYSGFDFNNCSIACDVYPTALGSAGFSFPFSVGGSGTGFAVVEIGGKWYLINHSVGYSAAGPSVVLNTWTHLEVVRRDFGSGVQARLFINGADPGISISTLPNTPANFFFVGANRVASGPEGQFRGQIDNVVLNNAAPVILRGIQASPSTNVAAGTAFTLSTTVAGVAPLSFAWRRNGLALTNSAASPAVTFGNVTVDDSGSYDFVVTNQYGKATGEVVNITVTAVPPPPPGTLVARYRLGEDDPGAVAGSPGNALTKDSMGTNDLAAFGTPIYSSNAPGSGSSLSMSFNGASWYQSGGAGISNLFSGFDFGQFSLSCDVYPTALDNFNFAVAIGGNAAGGGGFALLQQGTWGIIHQGQVAAYSSIAPALNTWTHLELRRRDFGSGVQTRLFVNGFDAGIALNTTPGNIRNLFTIGANQLTSGAEGYFKGQIDNVTLVSFTPPSAAQLSAQIVSGKVEIECAGTPGATYTLWRTLGLNPVSWTSVAAGTPDLGGKIVLTDPSPPPAGAFYRASSP